tara:strand:+ start:2296 stop:2556 length:261 start_codon:yes stop_codon:yes gene_type:complete
MIGRLKGDYWKAGENIVKLQIKTSEEQRKIEEILPGWNCVSYGYVPKTEEDIYVFEKKFKSENDWTDFLKSDTLSEQIEMKEVLND